MLLSTDWPDDMGERATFTLVLRAEPGIEPVAALRAMLKRALRDHGLRCVRVAEVPGAEHVEAVPVVAGGDCDRR